MLYKMVLCMCVVAATAFQAPASKLGMSAAVPWMKIHRVGQRLRRVGPVVWLIAQRVEATTRCAGAFGTTRFSHVHVAGLPARLSAARVMMCDFRAQNYRSCLQ